MKIHTVNVTYVHIKSVNFKFLFFILIDVITPDEFLNLAMDLHKHDLKSRDMAEQLASSLGVNKEEEVQVALSRYSHWQRILIILLGWQKKIGSDQATKQKLSNVLVRLRITRDVWHRNPII